MWRTDWIDAKPALICHCFDSKSVSFQLKVDLSGQCRLVEASQKSGMATLRLAFLLWLPLVAVSVTITGHIYCDNYFEFYFNGQRIATDPLDFTPHNAVKVSFEYDESAGTGKTYAILCQDYASDSGYEYISTNSPQLGDGALLAEFSDGTTTSSAWKSFVVTFGPTDASISSGCSASNLSPCAVQDNGVPQNWYESSFDDSSWATATEYTASQAGWGRTPSYSNGQCGTITSPITKETASPSSIATTADECLNPRTVLCGGDQTCDGSDGRFIWGADMDRDNKMLFRYTTSTSGDTAGNETTTMGSTSASQAVSSAGSQCTLAMLLLATAAWMWSWAPNGVPKEVGVARLIEAGVPERKTHWPRKPHKGDEKRSRMRQKSAESRLMLEIIWRIWASVEEQWKKKKWKKKLFVDVLLLAFDCSVWFWHFNV